MITVLRGKDHVAQYVEQIAAMADSSKDALGFLPESVYREQATKELLWTAIDNESNQLTGL